jgi:hypothetical protein
MLDEPVENLTAYCVPKAPPVKLAFTVSPAQVSPCTVGLWEWSEPRGSNMSLYRQQGIPHPYTDGFEGNFTGLRYNYPFLPPDKVMQCMSTRTTCLVGDSQMRHHYHHIASFLHGAGKTANCNKQSANCAVDGSRFHYVNFRYGPQWADISGNISALNCSHVVINFGQWPISHKEAPVPWSYTKYRDEVEKLFTALSNLTAQVFWTDTNSYPPNPMLKACPPQDWRFPHVVAYYNEIAALSLRMFPRLRSIRLHDVAFQLWDLSYDGAHYNYPVGPASAQYVLTSLCA